MRIRQVAQNYWKEETDMRISLKRSISMLFSFFMAFFLFAFILLCVIRFTLMNPSYIISKMDSVEFYENAVTELNRTIKQNAQPAGFELELFDNFVTTADVQEAMKSYVKDGFKGNLKSIDTTGFEQKLSKTIQGYANTNSITITADLQRGIDNFVSANLENYHHFLEFPFLDYYVQGYNLYKRAFLIAAPLMGNLTMVMAYVICRMHKSRRRKKRYLAYGFIGAGLMISAFPLYLIAAKSVERIQLSPQYLYNLIVQLGTNCLYILIIMGILFVLTGVFLTYFKPKKKGTHIKRDYSKSVMNHLEQ